MRPSILLALMTSSVGARAARLPCRKRGAFLSLPRTTLSIRTMPSKSHSSHCARRSTSGRSCREAAGPRGFGGAPTCLTRLAVSKALGRRAPSHASEPHAGYVANTGDAALHEISDPWRYVEHDDHDRHTERVLTDPRRTSPYDGSLRRLLRHEGRVSRGSASAPSGRD